MDSLIGAVAPIVWQVSLVVNGCTGEALAVNSTAGGADGGAPASLKALRMVRVLRLVKLLKILRILKVQARVDDISDKFPALLNNTFVRLLMPLTATMYTAHCTRHASTCGTLHSLHASRAPVRSDPAEMPQPRAERRASSSLL